VFGSRGANHAKPPHTRTHTRLQSYRLPYDWHDAPRRLGLCGFGLTPRCRSVRRIVRHVSGSPRAHCLPPLPLLLSRLFAVQCEAMGVVVDKTPPTRTSVHEGAQGLSHAPALWLFAARGLSVVIFGRCSVSHAPVAPLAAVLGTVAWACGFLRVCARRNIVCACVTHTTCT
jgi:hypothetical protein